jgi:hypothetical protein
VRFAGVPAVAGPFVPGRTLIGSTLPQAHADLVNAPGYADDAIARAATRALDQAHWKL